MYPRIKKYIFFTLQNNYLHKKTLNVDFRGIFYRPVGNFLKQSLKHCTISLRLFTNPEAEGKQRLLTDRNAARSCNTSTLNSKIQKLQKVKVKKYKRLTAQLPWNYFLDLVLTLSSTLCFMFDLQQLTQD